VSVSVCGDHNSSENKAMSLEFRQYVLGDYGMCLKLNGTHQLLVYADDVNILGGRIHTVNENAEALVVATKETGL
jgi:hypothetical protein